MRSFLKIAAVVACAYVLCGFGAPISWNELNHYHGKPVSALVARLGEPIHKGAVDGNRLYYWQVTNIFGPAYACKVWTIVDQAGRYYQLGVRELRLLILFLPQGTVK